MHRLIQRLALAGFWIGRAKRRRRQHAKRSGQHRRNVGKHVTEQVVGNDDIELLGPAHELHATGIRKHVGQFHIGIFFLVRRRYHLIPQNARLHDIAFFHGTDLVAAGPCQFERHTGNPLDFIGVVNLGIDCPLLAIAKIGDRLGFAEINAARQLAHDQDIKPLDHILFQRRGFRQRRIADCRAQIGEQFHLLAQAQQAGFRANVIGNTIPLRPANSAEQHRIGAKRLCHVIIRNRLAMGVIGRTANQTLIQHEPRAFLLVHPVDELAHFRHGFRANAVAGEQKEVLGHVCRFHRFGIAESASSETAN